MPNESITGEKIARIQSSVSALDQKIQHLSDAIVQVNTILEKTQRIISNLELKLAEKSAIIGQLQAESSDFVEQSDRLDRHLESTVGEDGIEVIRQRDYATTIRPEHLELFDLYNISASSFWVHTGAWSEGTIPVGWLAGTKVTLTLSGLTSGGEDCRGYYLVPSAAINTTSILYLKLDRTTGGAVLVLEAATDFPNPADITNDEYYPLWYIPYNGTAGTISIGKIEKMRTFHSFGKLGDPTLYNAIIFREYNDSTSAIIAIGSETGGAGRSLRPTDDWVRAHS